MHSGKSDNLGATSRRGASGPPTSKYESVRGTPRTYGRDVVDVLVALINRVRSAVGGGGPVRSEVPLGIIDRDFVVGDDLVVRHLGAWVLRVGVGLRLLARCRTLAGGILL